MHGGGQARYHNYQNQTVECNGCVELKGGNRDERASLSVWGCFGQGEGGRVVGHSPR